MVSIICDIKVILYENVNAMESAIRPPGLTALLELLGKDQFQIGALRHIMTSHV